MTTGNPARNQGQAKLWSMIKGIKVAMMTSCDGEAMHGCQEACGGSCNSYQTGSWQDRRDWPLRSAEPCLRPPRHDHLCRDRGPGPISDDRDGMRKCWRPKVGAWFSQGLCDPELALAAGLVRL